MNHELLWNECLAEAQRRVEAAKAEFPCCEDAVAFDVGGGESDTSSKFERKGTSTTQRSFSLDSLIGDVIRANAAGAAIPTGLQDAENSWLTTLLGRNDQTHGGTSLLESIKSMLTGTFTGSGGLDTIIARNPYSQDYENSTAALYNRSFNQARAAAQSGPANVRGGQARTGFELADLGTQQSMNRFREIRGQQDKEASTVMNAVQLANMIENLRRGQQVQATQADEGIKHVQRGDKLEAAGKVNQKRATSNADLNLASQVLGVPTSKTTDNLTGKGVQATDTSNWGVGLTCCFIFLEALNGRLPSFVRLGRDRFNTPNRRAGYRWMSAWLVPAMRRSAVVSWLVNTLMVRPFLYQGFSFFVLQKHSVLAPVCYMWFWVWSFLGWCGLNAGHELEETYGILD